jgi:hypothetical protein
MAPVEPRSRARRFALSTASATVVALVVAGVVVAPQQASAVPSWSEVQAARGNAAATKKQVQQITASLDQLQTKAAGLSQRAIDADAANARAQGALQQATAAASTLQAQVAGETKKADIAHRQAGQLAAHLYRIGSAGSLDGQLFSGRDASGTLYRLGALSQLSAQWQAVLTEATVASNSVTSLGAQAKVAAAERDRLAGVAATALASAQRSQALADAEVSNATAQQKTLYSQLATLNNTTATLEKSYHDHQVALASYRALLVQQHDAKVAAYKKSHPAPVAVPAPAPVPVPVSNPGGSGGGSGAGSGGPTPPPTGVIDDPAAAQAYASASLGSHGWAPSQFQCLVNLWNQESGWRTSALNVSSGAYGIPQSLPASKMSSVGLDWQTSYRTQITWGLGYIQAAYGSPCGAWAHEVSNNWY